MCGLSLRENPRVFFILFSNDSPRNPYDTPFRTRKPPSPQLTDCRLYPEVCGGEVSIFYFLGE